MLNGRSPRYTEMCCCRLLSSHAYERQTAATFRRTPPEDVMQYKGFCRGEKFRQSNNIFGYDCPAPSIHLDRLTKCTVTL